MSWRSTLTLCLVPAAYAPVVYLAALADYSQFVWIHLAVSLLTRVWISARLVKRDVSGAAGMHAFVWGVIGRAVGGATLLLLLLLGWGSFSPSMLGGADEFPVPDIFIGIIGWDFVYLSFASGEFVVVLIILGVGLLCSGAWQYGLTMLVEWNRDRKEEPAQPGRPRLR